jgi:hypothetical protein
MKALALVLFLAGGLLLILSLLITPHRYTEPQDWIVIKIEQWDQHTVRILQADDQKDIATAPHIYGITIMEPYIYINDADSLYQIYKNGVGRQEVTDSPSAFYMEDDGWLYYLLDSTLYRHRRDARERVIEIPAGYRLNALSGEWVVLEGVPIKSFSIRTGNWYQLTESHTPSILALEDGWVYYEDGGDMYRIHPDGTHREQLTDTPQREKYFTIQDNRLLFIRDNLTYELIPGDEPRIVADLDLIPFGSVTFHWIDDHQLLVRTYTESGTGEWLRLNLETATLEPLDSGEAPVIYMGIINDWIYYTRANRTYPSYRYDSDLLRVHASGYPVEFITDIEVQRIAQSNDHIILETDRVLYRFDGEQVTQLTDYPAEYIGTVPAPQKSWSPFVPLVVGFVLMGLATTASPGLSIIRRRQSR